MRSAEWIDGPDDPRVALFRGVRDPELARSAGVFVAEGRFVVRRVLDDPHYRVRALLLNEAAYRDLESILDRLNAVPAYVCNTAAFNPITGFNIHRGCLALVDRPEPTSIHALSANASRIVALDGVSNPDNVGGIFRNAAAFGADGVLLGPTSGDPLYRKAVRTSMGAALRVPFARAEDWPADLVRLRQHGFTIVALTPREPSEAIDAFAARASALRIALVAGEEGSGLTPIVESAADVRVRIPIACGVDSLNVAVAVGIALFALRRV